MIRNEVRCKNYLVNVVSSIIIVINNMHEAVIKENTEMINVRYLTRCCS